MHECSIGSLQVVEAEGREAAAGRGRLEGVGAAEALLPRDLHQRGSSQPTAAGEERCCWAVPRETGALAEEE